MPLRKRATPSLTVELLEDRSVPTTSPFAVTSLQDSGAGSLRQAILNANAHVGADVINFSVAGTVRLTTGALPAITDQVDVDGTSVPGFAGTPLVEVDYNHFGGLRFNTGSAGSALRSLGLVNATGAGVTFNGAGSMRVVGNFIGLGLNGATVAGNGNGIQLNGGSGSTIGGAAAWERNVISGNQNNGIYVSGSSNNQILGNYIGTDVTGTLDRGNTRNGVVVTDGASGNIIGGSARNVISGNDANGVVILGKATLNNVSGNIIGLTASGNKAIGNTLDGVRIDNADHTLIGQRDPVTGVTYDNADNFGVPVSAWQGIRNADTSGQYLIAGTSGADGLLFEGTLSGVGTSYAVNYPNAATTSVYGPDNLGGGNVRLVGSYKNSDPSADPVTVHGFLFEGPIADLSQSGNYRTLDYVGAKYNYVHSTMEGFAVGNYDSPTDPGDANLPLGPIHAYIYDVGHSVFLTDVVFPGARSNTAYGIWFNGGTSYTICGGYSFEKVNNFDDQNRPIGHAYLVDYDSATGQFTNWASFDYPSGTNVVTHFEGISSVEKGVYTLNADSSANLGQGSLVTVRRNANGSFGPGAWVNLNFPLAGPGITSSNSVIGNHVVGVVIGAGGTFSYQATVNVGFQLSNVISGNGENGIELYAANYNRIAMNNVGTDVTGTLDLGNARNGILVTAGAMGNIIGGEATGGNDPTAAVFVRPPQGNLISGNNADGVLINGMATQNTLSGNFIGTAASGNAALGNSLDGVAIANADGNALIGCSFQQNPFVFYNVISGNGNNGLRVTNSNNTTIQANFFGIGADNNTAVGNLLNGVVVEGSSDNTLMGGPIPLGNVDAANGQNGIVVRDSASHFVSYNTFCGIAAFSDNLNLGNGWDGMLITTTGGNILIRTCVISRNGNDGVEISGAARDVRVAGNIIGLNTQGIVPMGNVRNGVEVNGNAHDVLIGGPQPTFNIIPHNAISANGGNGVAVNGNAHVVTVNHSYIGTDLTGQATFGNGNAGVYIGEGAYSTLVGSADPNFLTVISGNLGNGVEMRGTTANRVAGALIGTSAFGLLPLPNGGNGIFISNSVNNVFGRSATAANGTSSSVPNVIAFSGADGVRVDSGSGNAILDNSIYANALLGIDLGPWANMNQAPPVLNSVLILPLGTQVSGTLTSSSNTTLTVEFFANDTNAPSGRHFLGSRKVMTSAAGVAAFTFLGPLLPSGAHFVTATATDPNNNTSEFSAAASSVS